jgi:diaminohydroxyphosphoribosylaminopyrimidine deaminase / 5-amino-6-(5-phosphoribosylamino)uracil reductase
VTLKLAVSADGKAGLAGRKSAPITGEAARARTHLMRATNDAVLIGIGTALADDPQLTCRLPGMAGRSPVRVVLDTRLRLPPSGTLAASAGETPVWVMAGEAGGEDAERVLRARNVEVIRCRQSGSRLDLAEALRQLAARGITRLMVEGGPTIAAAFVAADLVDEAAVLRSPRSIGSGIDALEGMPLTALTASPRLISRGIETIGEDVLERFERT